MLHILLFVFVVLVFFADEIVKFFCAKPDYVDLFELGDHYLVESKPGHIMVVVVITNASERALLQKFTEEVFALKGIKTLHFHFLNTDEYCNWLPSLFGSTSSVGESQPNEEGSSDYSGHILALNGHKRNFSVYCPVVMERHLNDAFSSSVINTCRNGECTKTEHNTTDVCNKLNKLGVWLEKLMEGTLPNFQVSDWPALVKPENRGQSKKWQQRRNVVK